MTQIDPFWKFNLKAKPGAKERSQKRNNDSFWHMPVSDSSSPVNAVKTAQKAATGRVYDSQHLNIRDGDLPVIAGILDEMYGGGLLLDGGDGLSMLDEILHSPTWDEELAFHLSHHPDGQRFITSKATNWRDLMASKKTF